MMIPFRSSLPVVLTALVLSSCYPIEERRDIPPASITEERTVTAPTKIHMTDGSVILCEQGFTVMNDVVTAIGDRFYYLRTDAYAGGTWSFPLDSVTGFEYFETVIPGARAPGSLLVGVTQLAGAGLGALFIFKAIFGSCPTVYSVADATEHLEAECFSFSIGRQFETDDLDRLTGPAEKEGIVSLRIRNEALETHYIDRFELLYTDHPEGTEVFPDGDGEVIVASGLRGPSSAVDADGNDVLPQILHRDATAFSRDSTSVARMFAERRRDWIECVVPVPEHAAELTVAMRARNSLQNTVLLYDVMMANQGLNVLDWTQRVNESMLYAWELWSWYKDVSGIELFVEEDGGFVSKGRIPDTGPIAWKLAASRMNLGDHGGSVRVRLVFLPDSWSIDWLGFTTDGAEAGRLEEAECILAEHTAPGGDGDVRAAIADDDEAYLATYPGERVDLQYRVGPASAPAERTYFVRSNGYYVEWVRPEWVRFRPDVPGFEVGNREQIMADLEDRWMSAKNSFEAKFYGTKVPGWSPEVRR